MKIGAILGIANASFLIALGVYCFARIYPPELLIPFQSTIPILTGQAELFGSAPSFFYTLAVGLLVGACASTPTSARVHCLAWICLTLFLEASQHPIVVEPLARWLSESSWGLVGPYWMKGTFDQLDLIASIVGGFIALAILTYLSPKHNDER